MLFSIVYELLLIFGFLIHLPKAMFQFFRFGKYKESFVKRLGLCFPRVKKKGDGPIVWIHGGSVGEVLALQSFVKQLKAELLDATFVISCVTETGMAQAKKALSFCDYHVFLPFDFYFVVKSVLKKCSPDLVILCESDFWYRFLASVKKNGAVTVVINGKISERSYKRFYAASFFTKRLFQYIDHFCVQSQEYYDRFSSLGIPQTKITVLGNIKADVLPSILSPDEKEKLMQKHAFCEQDIIIAIGSTHDPEEELLMDSLCPLLKKYAHLRIILVPRHPERIEDVKKVLERVPLAYSLWSAPNSNPDYRVLIVDQMGVLCTCYQLAHLAIVAGSYTQKIGGHNILEPMALGIPTICGPFMHSQNELLQLAKKHNAVMQLHSQELKDKITTFLENPKSFRLLQENASTMMQEMKGSTKKTCSIIVNLVPQFLKNDTSAK